MNTTLNKLFFASIISALTFSCQTSNKNCDFFVEGKFIPEEDIFEEYYLVRQNNVEKMVYSNGTIDYSNLDIDYKNCIVKVIPQDVDSSKLVNEYITYSDIRVIGDTIYTKKTFYQNRVGVSENTYFIKVNF